MSVFLVSMPELEVRRSKDANDDAIVFIRSENTLSV